MFGMGWPELLVVGIVGMLVFGPDRLPDLARQAGSFLRTVRTMIDNAKNDIGREIGHDLRDVDLRNLDPREVVRKHLLDDEPVKPQSATRSAAQPQLGPRENPPFDPDST